jgi:hypothetical protein
VVHHRNRKRLDVYYRALLLAALHGVQQVRNRDRGQDADDRDDDQQLDEGEAGVSLFHFRQTARVRPGMPPRSASIYARAGP